MTRDEMVFSEVMCSDWQQCSNKRPTPHPLQDATPKSYLIEESDTDYSNANVNFILLFKALCNHFQCYFKNAKILKSEN